VLQKLQRFIFTGKGVKMSKCLVGNNIRKLRFNTNEMTQQQLAEKTGVTRQTIVAIENGKYSPSLELAFRVALVFGLPLEEVFSYKPIHESDEK
jgi:putative transcriptional regulator